MPATPGDRQQAVFLVLRQLEPVPGRLIDRNAIENLRTNIEHAPAWALPLRLAILVLEEVFARAERQTSQHLHEATQLFRRELGDDEPAALELVDRCLDKALASEAETARLNAPWFASLLAIVVALLVFACAHAPQRRACREECVELRGPTWSLWGGPTLPPAAWEDCVAACESRTEETAPCW